MMPRSVSASCSDSATLYRLECMRWKPCSVMSLSHCGRSSLPVLGLARVGSIAASSAPLSTGTSTARNTSRISCADRSPLRDTLNMANARASFFSCSGVGFGTCDGLASSGVMSSHADWSGTQSSQRITFFSRRWLVSVHRR